MINGSYGCTFDNANSSVIEDIPDNIYYSTDIVPDIYNEAYGNWKVIRTSGGFSGGGYEIDFDNLVLKSNGIFGIIKNGSLIAYGKMILTQNKGGLLCQFEADEYADIELLRDPERYIQIINRDTLNLDAPCCDRYNIHFIREN